eukprot:10638754-Lingulodinium_polyedra.AAC.1
MSCGIPGHTKCKMVKTTLQLQGQRERLLMWLWEGLLLGGQEAHKQAWARLQEQWSGRASSSTGAGSSTGASSSTRA